MQIEIYNPKTESDYIQSIDWNHEQLKKEITQALEKYQGRVYTDETIKEAKADRANLNKFTEALENKRKEIKKLCLKPYEDFETQVKELVSLVDAPKLAIDTQVKTFEQKKQGEKKAQIEAFYAENVGDLASLIPLDKIFKKEWLNVTVSMKKVETEISEILNKVQFDLATIKDLKSEFELNMQDTYLQTFDISAALREKTRLEERRH